MSEVSKPFDIPNHWRWSTFDELGEWTGGGTPSKRKTSYWEGDIPWVSPKDMKRLEIEDTEDHVTAKAIEESTTKSISADSILFVTRSGILERTLPTARAAVDVTINQDLKALTLSENVDSQFLLYYTRAAERSILRQCSKHGTTVASLESGRLYRFPVPVPPLSEQRRIVAKIEELFSNLDAGRADLQTAQRQLERYRLSVLQAAVEGRLSAAWRRTHTPEPADALLEQILEERRKRWEKQYRWERYDSKGKEPPSGWKSRYKEPESPDTEELSELPEGWVWASVIQVGDVVSGKTAKGVKEAEGEDIPWYRVGDMNLPGNETHMHDSRVHVGEEEAKELKLRIQPAGTIIFPKRGGAIATGKKRILTKPSAYDLNTMGIYPWAVHSGFFRYWFESVNLESLSDGSNVPQLNHGDIEPLPVPIPPLAEQQQIANEVERLLSVADDAAQTTEREQTRAERLRQSILKQAFNGQLVPHEGGTASAPAPSGNGTQRPGEQIELGL